MAMKSYLCLTQVYFEIFRSEASSAAAPLTADVLGRSEWARVSGIVSSHMIIIIKIIIMIINESNNNLVLTLVRCILRTIQTQKCTNSHTK